jgi:hypothetical protein
VLDGDRDGFERLDAIALAHRLLRDAHGERGREAGVLLRHEPSLRELRGERLLTHQLRDANARGEHGRANDRIAVDRGALDGGRGGVGRRERLIEERGGASELARDAVDVGCAKPRVDGVRRLANPTRNAKLVPAIGVHDGLVDQRGLRLDRRRVRLGALLRFVASRRAGLGAGEALGRDRHGERRAAAKAARRGETVKREVHVAGVGRNARKVEVQETLPGRVRRALRALAERLFAEGPVAGARGQHLEHQPGLERLWAGQVERRRFARGGGGAERVLLHVLEKRCPHEQRASRLLRRRGRAGDRVDDATQVLEGLAPLEQAHEALERLAVRRIRVEGREVVARRGDLVARPLRQLAELPEQTGLPTTLGGPSRLCA